MAEGLTRRRLLTAGALTAAAALAGCQDGGEPTTTASTPTPNPGPRATVSFDYDGDAGTVKITHDAGDAVPASELYVRGSGFADAEGADMTAPGQWAGGTSDGSVRVGNAVTVGVNEDYDLQVVWESPTGPGTSILGEDSGPAA